MKSRVQKVIAGLAAISLSAAGLGCSPLSVAKVRSSLEGCETMTSRCQWETRYRFLDRVRRGANPIGSDYGEAVGYFEAVTQIDSGIAGSFGGRILNRSALDNALKTWSSWCESRAECPSQLEYSAEIDWNGAMRSLDPHRKN